jgi:multidrug efflux system membrane fusion protein
MRSSIVIAGVLAVGATAWIASGQFGGPEQKAAANGSTSDSAAPAAPLVQVRVRSLVARSLESAVIVNGRTEESRRVTLRAETAGPVVKVAAVEGAVLEAGDIVVRQDVEDRNAHLAERMALVRQREIEFHAAEKLAKKGFRSDTKVAEARALLDAARAQVKSMRIDLARTAIRAPFRGILETRFVEKGDYVTVGDNVASIVDLDPVLAVGYVSERAIGAIQVNGAGRVTFIDGKSLEGKVRFISSVADSQTRSFRVELEIPNPDHGVRAGLTGELSIPLAPVTAHVISPAGLTLADDGRIGVRIADADDIVRFVPIRILSDTAEGLWVSGLTDGDRLITIGHEYVKAGQKVRAVAETAVTGS